MFLCLPCHRQRGGCELFQLPKPESTSDEAEKAKEISQMSTEKPQELWSREPPHNGRCAKNKNILWISLISRARGSPSRPTERIMCIIWSKDFMFGAVVTWDFQVGCTKDMSSFCPKGRSTSITSKYLHFFQPYNKTVITDSSMVRFVTSFLLAEFWLEHLTADLT